MRKTSIVLLILSAILLIAGSILCLYASHLSKSTNTPLFDSTTQVREDGARVYDFTDQNISCLKFDVEKVDVQIQPSADENSYMELYDFGNGTYDISRSNNWLTITNESGLSSLYQVLEDQENNEGGSSFLGLHLDNFRFRGLRYFFRFSPAPSNARPRINVYVSAQSSLKIISADLEGGSITVNQMKLPCDYDIAGTQANITFTGVNTNSKVEIEDAQGNVTLDNSTISACYLEMGTGNFAADDLCVALFTGHLKQGDARVTLRARISDYRRFLRATGGTLSVDGNDKSKRNQQDTGFGYFQLISDKGDVSVTSGQVAADENLGVRVDASQIEQAVSSLNDSLDLTEYE